MCKKHWADSANMIMITKNKYFSGLKVKCVKMPNASYTHR